MSCKLGMQIITVQNLGSGHNSMMLSRPDPSLFYMRGVATPDYSEPESRGVGQGHVRQYFADSARRNVYTRIKRLRNFWQYRKNGLYLMRYTKRVFYGEHK